MNQMIPSPPDRVTRALRTVVERFEVSDERAFLPAALEILETPPSPVGRLVAMLIGVFFLIGLAWAIFGKVDIIATAEGRLLPSGRTKVIQPLDPGVVKSVAVQDGDHVRSGQVLITLDPTSLSADRDRLRHDLLQARMELARLTALTPVAEGRGGARSLGPIEGATPEDRRQAEAALQAQLGEQQAKVAGIDQQILAKTAEAGEASALLNKSHASLPMLVEKERLHRQLRDQGYGTSFAYLDAQQQASDARLDINVQEQRLAQTRATTSALRRERAQAVSAFAALILSDLTKAKDRVSALSQDLIKAEQKSEAAEIRAPIDGVVEELAVHTVGGVVTPAQRLLVIVPDNQQLTIEAQLANRDVGFVHPGQDVAIKIETFNFTRYGLLHGRVIDVSRDAVAQAARQAEDPTNNGPPPPAASPSYLARIRLDATNMMVDGRQVSLSPGMAVTAEIKTGRRTIIDYLLSPIARRSNEALHER